MPVESSAEAYARSVYPAAVLAFVEETRRVIRGPFVRALFGGEMDRPKTFNRPQVIALYSLVNELGNGCEITVLTHYTIGDILVEAKTALGDTTQWTLPVAGGRAKVTNPQRREPSAEG